jgi:hypothetical protein
LSNPKIHDRQNSSGHGIGNIKSGFNILWQLDPDIASFYVLTPIPGTEQYAEFLGAGVLTEPNLDRYDTTYPTWRHPSLFTSTYFFEAVAAFLAACHFFIISESLFLTAGSIFDKWRFFAGF